MECLLHNTSKAFPACTDKNRKRWSALTTYQAPHKPFLLLSIMDLIAQGSIAERIKICLT